MSRIAAAETARAWLAVSTAAILIVSPIRARAQSMPDMPGMPAGAKPASDSMVGMDMGSGVMMAGALGSYSMMRDASGTSWQPDSTPMEGINGAYGGWSTMLHGNAFGV